MLSISEIVQSIQIPQLIKDSFIAQGHPLTDKKSYPIHYCGGFAVVFPFEVNDNKWAFRCWSADLGNIGNRLRTLSEELKRLNLPYFCEFYYEPEGIVVGGKMYPTTRMRWIDGTNIKDYIYENRNDRKRLLSLASKFLEMCKTLHMHSIAHGDLQHGNIIIDDCGDLFLIDYDSVYLPALSGEPDIITGLKEYQHPSRANNTESSEKLDYFSELIIYLSIIAIAENPQLAEDYQIKDADRLLFQSKDFTNLINSKIYHDISKLGKEFELYLLILEEYLSKSDINELESLDKLLDEYSKEPQIITFKIKDDHRIYEDSDVTLCWDVENCKKIYINGIEQNLSNHFFAEHIKKTKTYELEAVNGFHRVKSTLVVKTIRVPVISLKSSLNKVRKGKDEIVLLKWSTNNAVKVNLLSNGNVIAQKKHGELSVHVNETTVFEIQAVGLDGEKTFTKIIKVYAFTESSVMFETNKEFTYPGLPVVLKWDVQNAKKVELRHYGEQPMMGFVIVEPKSDTVYTLLVSDAFGQKRYSLTVKMIPLPILNNLYIPLAPEVPSVILKLQQPKISIAVSLPQTNYVNLNLPKVNLENVPDSIIRVVPPPLKILPQFKLESVWDNITKMWNSYCENVKKRYNYYKEQKN